ncbi:hypothetical protein MBLNU13_g05592t1 [Cladosporium sp. NU13]
MSEHSSTNVGDLLNDVDMEDLSDLTEALPAPATTPVPHDEAHDDAIVTEDATRCSSAEGGTSSAQDYARDNTDDNMTDDAGATSAEREATPTQQDQTNVHDEVARLRYELLTSAFSDQVVELKHFASPPQCEQHPDYAEEVLGAFLDHATFTAKVWINFDAAEEVFFEGARAADCGKLQIPRAKLNHLNDLDSDIYNFRRIRLDIGTPFRTLVKIWLTVHDRGNKASLEIRGKLVVQNPPLRTSVLYNFLVSRIQTLQDVGSDQNLDLEDLNNIAKTFRRQREDDDEENEWEKPCYGGGEWAGVEEPIRRFGWWSS